MSSCILPPPPKKFCRIFHTTPKNTSVDEKFIDSKTERSTQKLVVKYTSLFKQILGEFSCRDYFYEHLTLNRIALGVGLDLLNISILVSYLNFSRSCFWNRLGRQDQCKSHLKTIIVTNCHCLSSGSDRQDHKYIFVCYLTPQVVWKQ